MNTPAHLIFAAAAFAKPHERPRTLAALAGALAPDLSLYLLAGVSIFILGYSPHHVFDVMYFSDAWQQVFAIDNSFVFWGLGLGVAWYYKSAVGMIFTASALLHLVFDFPLHNDDARPHFWPITTWVFESPYSYWDIQHHAGIIGPIEIGLSLILCCVLFFRFGSLRSRSVICVAAALQLSPFFIWAWVFATGAT